MTTIIEATEAVLGAFAAVWSAPFITDNEDQAPPADGTSWARIVVRDEASDQETLGIAPQRKFERHARVIVQIFAPVNQGIKPALALGVTVRNAFEGVTLSGPLHFRGVLVRQASGGQTDGRWVMVIVEAPFTYWEQK